MLTLLLTGASSAAANDEREGIGGDTRRMIGLLDVAIRGIRESRRWICKVIFP